MHTCSIAWLRRCQEKVLKTRPHGRPFFLKKWPFRGGLFLSCFGPPNFWAQGYNKNAQAPFVLAPLHREGCLAGQSVRGVLRGRGGRGRRLW